MDVIYRRGEATAGEVFDELPDAPSYNAVRAALRALDEKGYVRHERQERRYIYRPTVPARQARQAAVRNLLHTFFGGSAERLLSALFEDRDASPDELDRLERLIESLRAKEQIEDPEE